MSSKKDELFLRLRHAAKRKSAELRARDYGGMFHILSIVKNPALNRANQNG
jgi:hypothetical protein